jgi:uncharacterized protein
MREEPAVTDPIADELQLIRNNVPGVRGSITATADGLLVAHDVPGLEPTQIAALVAATHAVAVRASLSTECGQLKEVITRGNDGYLAVYAAGGAAILAVLGTTDLNVAMLNFRARKVIERIAEQSGDLARRPLEDSPAVPASPGPVDEGREGGAPLPARRPRQLLGELPEPVEYLAQDVNRRRLVGAEGSLRRQLVLRLVTHRQALPVRVGRQRGRAGPAGFP